MRQYLALAGLGLVAALVAGILWYRGQAIGARADLAAAERRAAALEAQVIAAQEAAEVHRAHIERLQEMAERAGALERYINSLEGGDAPLPDYLRDVGRQLWP